MLNSSLRWSVKSSGGNQVPRRLVCTTQLLLASSFSLSFEFQVSSFAWGLPSFSSTLIHRLEITFFGPSTVSIRATTGVDGKSTTWEKRANSRSLGWSSKYDQQKKLRMRGGLKIVLGALVGLSFGKVRSIRKGRSNS